MRRRHNLAHFLLANAVVLGLTPLMVCVDAQAQIAFSSDRDGNFHGHRNIYTMDADGGNPRRVIKKPFHSFNNWDPSWSPDGKRITFVSERAKIWEIYIMKVDGGNPQRLTNNHFTAKDPSWSPDGKRIAFTSGRDGNLEIYVMEADGGNRRNLTNNPFSDREPSWSPDGRRIAFVSNRDGNFEIYVMDADGDNQHNLTNNPHADTAPAWFNPAFSVAPAGKQFTMWGWIKQVKR